jgi:MFS family permease
LIGQIPSQYVVNRYLDFHQKSDAMTGLRFDAFDRFLLNISARSPFWARMADSYASTFRKGSIVRKKLVVTLALLECVAPSCEVFDNADGRSLLATLASLGWRAAMYAFLLGASVVVFTPVRAAMVFSWKPRAEAMLEH